MSRKRNPLQWRLNYIAEELKRIAMKEGLAQHRAVKRLRRDVEKLGGLTLSQEAGRK